MPTFSGSMYYGVQRGHTGVTGDALMRDFESQLRRELPTLFRVANRLARNAEEAEDLVGQTLYSACKAQKSFDGQYLRSWLIRIMRNEFNTVLRREGSRPTLVLEEHESVVDPFWDEVSWRVDAETILRELQNLSSEHRLIIQLCDVEEMSYEEAAAALEIPLGTVRSRLFRARAKLRDHLAGRITVEGGVR